MRQFRTVFCLVWLCALALPETATACAVCSSGDEESRSAFIWTTVLLSVLPPGMVGGVVWWLWRLHRRRDAAPHSLGNEGRSKPVTG